MATFKHIQLSVHEKSEEFTNNNYGEYSIKWKNVIFLPFNAKWRLLVLFTVIVNAIVVAYDISYDDTSMDLAVNYIYYTCQAIYLLDTILNIVHRNMPHYRGIREYQTRHLFYLIIDIVTLLPIYEIYVLLRKASHLKMNDSNLKFRIRTVILLRLYRVYYYFAKTSYSSTVNQIFAVCVGHFLKLSLMAHLISAIWYSISCWECERPNWTVNLAHHRFSPDNSIDWIIICYTTIGNMLACNWRGSIRGETSIERTIVMAVIIIGYLNHNMFFFGRLTRAYIKSFQRQFTFVDNMKSIKRLLADLGTSKEWRNRTIEYYTVFWERRSGLKKMPEAFLPTPLLKEITVDIYWEALRHSHLFGQEDIAFKRAVSFQMRSEFYLAGDYLYRRGKIKNKMIYVASGVIQVLTAEDQESPIISFSSGTVLGEIACLTPTKSIANVRCATYCEIHTLSHSTLHRLLQLYPGKTKQLHDNLKDRLKRGEYMACYVSWQPRKRTSAFTSVTQDSSIKWLKSQWRTCSKYQRGTGGIRKSEPVEDRIDPTHCSGYLDLLVLSDEVELRMQVVCLQGRCPFILEPNSSFRRFTHYVAFAATIAQAILLPYNISFKRRLSNTLKAVSFALDMIYVIDIYLQLSTAIKTQNLLISQARRIVMKRLKETKFLIDLFATIPADYIASLCNQDEHVIALLKLNRLLKVYSVIYYITKQENNLMMDSLKIRLMKYICMYALTCYWFSCLMYSFACFYESCYELGWFHLNLIMNKLTQRQRDIYQENPFLASWFYTLSTYLANPISTTYQFITLDIFGHHSIVLIGYFMYSFCFAGMCATLILHLQKRRNYQDYIGGMLEFLRTNTIRGKLKKHIMNMLQFWWYYNENMEVDVNHGILADATNEIKDKVLKQRMRECLKCVPLFSECNDKILNLAIGVSTIKTLPSNCTVLASEARHMMIHIILRGYCQLRSFMAGDRERKVVTTLKPGDAFPVVEVLHQVLTFINVSTITAVELISIKHSDLVDIMVANPLFGKPITVSLSEHMRNFSAPLLRKQGRLPEMVPVEHSLGPGDMFTYEIYDEDDELNPEETAYMKPFKKIGKWKCIRYVMLRNTIDPHKRFFICWEICRCIFAIIRILLGLAIYNLLMDYRTATWVVIHTLDVTCLLDFYVRMHCQYYNDIGILVTHPWCTAKYYLTTSFAIDLFSALPFQRIKIHEIFGHANKETVSLILVLISRPCQLHRLLGFIGYLQSNVKRTSIALQILKYAIIVTVVVSSLTVIVQVMGCTLKSPEENKGTEILCDSHSWLTTTPLKAHLTHPPSLYLLCLYVAVTLFSSASCGIFTVQNNLETIAFSMIFVFTFIVKAIIYAKLISHKVGGNVNLTIYQEQVKSFLKFVKTEYVDEDLIMETIEHYQYMWKKTQGANVSHTLKKFHCYLHEQVVYTLYGSTLELVDIFQGADNSFIKHIAVTLQIQHFKKDSEIIRCNDVQKLLYIVYKGKVDIMVGGMRMCTLGQGGIFGCLERQGITRHTITAIAKVHVELLFINSNQLHGIIGKFSMLREHLERKNYFRSEYVESTRRVIFGSDTSRAKLSSTGSIKKNLCARVYAKTRFVYKPDNIWYKIWDYVINVHVASITSLIFMFFIFMSPKEKKISTAIQVIIYIIDGIFLVKIFLGFHTAYINPESGILIRDHVMIRRKYLNSYTFWLNLLTCLPFELILRAIFSRQQWIRYGFANRMFRCLYLLHYYNHCQKKLYVKAHLRWTYLFYFLCIAIQIMVCCWWLAACIDDYCYISTSTHRSTRNTFTKMKGGIDSVIVAYLYVINLFTSTGLQDVQPMSYTQIGVSIIIICVYQSVAIVLSSEFATLLCIEHFTMGKYEHCIQQLRTYLEGRQLSPPIIEKVWKYSLQLWQRQRGEWMPTIVTEAPSYLKQDLMTALYGHYLQKHYLFSETHIDFQRQLVGHLKRCVFFPDNYLAEKGDLDGSMFFIHDGEVEVYDKMGNNENLRELVKKFHSVGEAQCLFNVPHQVSYKARTVVDALILKHSDWQYLLEWFPASHEAIMEKARNWGLKKDGTETRSRTFHEQDDDVIELLPFVESRNGAYKESINENLDLNLA